MLLSFHPLTAQPASSKRSIAAPSSEENLRLWSSFGDPYPQGPRKHQGITNFLLLEGPANANPGNMLNLPQNDPGLRMPMVLKQYIARQFRYVVFDQDSYAERDSAFGPVRVLMPPLYHEEAQALQKLNSEMIVFPYFCFTLVREQSPHWQSVKDHESWILHRTNPSENPDERIHAVEKSFLVMDVNNAEWRNFYIKHITGIVKKYHYRGVMLDNMTPFPWISPEDSAYVAPSLHAKWFGYVHRFLTDLKHALPKSVKVICNSVSLDPPDAKQPLWGASGGAAVAKYADGAMSEAFHITGWTENLRRELAVMKKMGDMGKLFLVVTHYTRGVDKNLADLFGLRPSVWTEDPGPSPETLQEMQMSYLARFLLGLPIRHSSNFAFSFVPGTTLYQYIPYYAIWDEDFGVPLTKSYIADGPVLRRQFTRSIVYVNDSESSATVTLPPDGGWLTYASFAQGAATVPDKEDVKSVTLLRHQGIILFKRP